MDQSEVMKFEQQNRTLKLSDAIRIGAKLRPQCHGGFSRDGGTCALGAAAEALGFDFRDWGLRGPSMYEVLERLPALRSARLRGKISQWNDYEKLTREQIADRLEAMGY